MPPAAAAGIEAAATSVQLLLVFAVLASSRHHQWGAPRRLLRADGIHHRGGSAQRRRIQPGPGPGPDLMAGAYPALWIYFVGPVVGNAAAAAAILALGWRPITGKLRYDGPSCATCGANYRTG